jgi:hypothetical protein
MSCNYLSKINYTFCQKNINLCNLVLFPVPVKSSLPQICNLFCTTTYNSSRAKKRVFSDLMMTVAAVDRLVHQAVIVEIKSDSYRRQVSTTRAQAT